MRSTTIADWPTSAAVPVLIPRVRWCARASGRSAASRMIETTRNAAHSIVAPAPAAARTAAIAAPPANGARKKPEVAISPMARPTAAISQSTQGSTDPIVLQALRGEQRFREVVGVERPQVLELLADADQLHRDVELVRDGQRDPALGRAVKLGEDDPGHAD